MKKCSVPALSAVKIVYDVTTAVPLDRTNTELSR